MISPFIISSILILIFDKFAAARTWCGIGFTIISIILFIIIYSSIGSIQEQKDANSQSTLPLENNSRINKQVNILNNTDIDNLIKGNVSNRNK
jgi:hypothetical protein